MFGWHLDNEDEKVNAKLSVVILLSNTKSFMQILIKHVLEYNGQGTAIIFLSCFFFTSHHAGGDMMKLCFVLKDGDDIIAPNIGIRVTRNTRVRKQSGNKDNLLTWNLQGVITANKISCICT